MKPPDNTPDSQSPRLTTFPELIGLTETTFREGEINGLEKLKPWLSHIMERCIMQSNTPEMRSALTGRDPVHAMQSGMRCSIAYVADIVDFLIKQGNR